MTSTTSKTKDEPPKTGKEEWLEIKFVGKYEADSIKPPVKDTNWFYTPSGRICSCIKVDDQESWRGISNMFTFVDLVDKAYFEMELYFKNTLNLHVTSCYFISEDELVVVAATYKIVKQLVYYIDYCNQTMLFKDMITHTFAEPISTYSWRGFPSQTNKFVRYGGIEYFVLISVEFPGSSHRIYMVPKDPFQENAPLKEFLFKFVDDKANLFAQTQVRMGQGGEIYDRMSFTKSISTCIVRKNKLWFNFEVKAFVNVALLNRDDENDRQRPNKTATLVGAYMTVDLAKLVVLTPLNLSSENDLNTIMEQQAHAIELVMWDKLYLTEDIHLSHFDNNVGLFNLFKNHKKHSQGESLALLHTTKMGNFDQPTVLECKFPEESEDKWDYRYTLHPHGTLLNFAYGKQKSIYISVMKNLKPNLKYLAFNRALFHKNTPIRDHLAYRLCFNGPKLIKYLRDNDEPENSEKKT